MFPRNYEAAAFVERGWGQVEANRLTGLTFGYIEAQAPAYLTADADEPIPALQNGQFLCVIADASETASPMGRIAVPPGEAPPSSKPFLVYSEKKLYDERFGYPDFLDVAAEKVDGRLYPRLLGITPDSDVFTTNTIQAEPGTLTVGTVLYINDEGYLAPAGGINENYQFVVTKVYTMPDGQEGVKLMSQAFEA